MTTDTSTAVKRLSEQIDNLDTLIDMYDGVPADAHDGFNELCNRRDQLAKRHNALISDQEHRR